MIRNNSINHKKSNIRGNNQDIYIFKPDKNSKRYWRRDF